MNASQPNGEKFSSKRISDWAPRKLDQFKVPQAGSDDHVVALVGVWSRWAGEKMDLRIEQDWRDHLERARDEEADARRRQAKPESAQELTLEQVEAHMMEVHLAALPDSETTDLPQLTPYLPRAHDTELREVLQPALAGRRSVLAMLTGESSTGKTRALYEAIHDLAPTRPLLRPVTGEDLLALIDGGWVTAGVVLWLNEAQRFFDGGTGEQAAARLRTVLEDQPGIAAVGSMWHKPYWEQLVQQGTPGDPHAQARALLTGAMTRRTQVPVELSPEDRDKWEKLAEQHADRRMRYALSAGASDGRVVQHLSGGPELLAAYLQGPGATFTHPEHALISAALDARRLGHYGPLPAALLADAADGTLAPRHRSPESDWAGRALQALSAGERSDGTRTDVRRTLTPLTALRTRSGAPARYAPADYLDQHTRAPRGDGSSGPALWSALVTHTADPEDRSRLFDESVRRGLFKVAVQLGRRAVLAGDTGAPGALVRFCDGRPNDPLRRAASWVVEQVDPTDREAFVDLLEALRAAGSQKAADVLVERAVTRIDIADPDAIEHLIDSLRRVGASRAIDELVRRVLDGADILTDAEILGRLVGTLKEAASQEEIDALADLAAVRADLGNPESLATVLGMLRGARAREAVNALVGRIAAHAGLIDPRRLSGLLREVQRVGAGAEQAFEVLLALNPASHIDLTDTQAVSTLLTVLWRAGAEQELSALLARGPASHIGLTDHESLDSLWWVLQQIDAHHAIITLADRTVAHTDLNDIVEVCELLERLRKVGARQALDSLLARDPAAHVALWRTNDFLPDAGDLLTLLREAGAERAADNLARRLAADVDLTDPEDLGVVLGMLREAGAESAINMLADRAASVPDPNISYVCLELRSVGVEHAAGKLADHIAAHADLTDADAVANLCWVLRALGAEQAEQVLLSRNPAAQVDVGRAEDPETVPNLLKFLYTAGAGSAADLLARRAAEEADTSNPFVAAGLLTALRDIRAEPAAQALVRRAAEHADLVNVYGVARLLRAMQAIGSEREVHILLERGLAEHVDVTGFAAKGIDSLLEVLGEVGAGGAAETLVRRFEDARAARTKPEPPPPYGLETNGRTAAPWTWDDVPLTPAGDGVRE